jgi:hypothetical protein
MTVSVRAAVAAWVVLVSVAGAQTLETDRLTVGGTKARPDGTTVRLDGLGTTGGTNVLFADGDGDIFERLLAASDIPSTFTQRNVAETISSAWTYSAGLLVSDGTVGTPALRFSSDVDTGLYRVGADSVGVSAGGVVRLTVNATGTTAAGDLAVNGNDITSTGVLRITPTGNLTLDPTGDVVLAPGGDDILPSAGYSKNLGALSNKYLTLHAAELIVETLVAQDTMATIGGRVLVGPTTVLTSDLASAATSIVVRHNQIASGDRVYLEAAGKVEFMAVTSGASGSGPYTYTVTRNLDGSGANDWFAGDAVFNSGTTGDGFIDLYSVDGVLSGAGPTIVGNVRTGTGYNNIAARWAVGNLNALYGYSGDTYGAAFGDPADVFVTIDATNGIRMIEGGSTVRGQWATDGSLTLGSTASGQGNMLVDTSGNLKLRVGTTDKLSMSSSTGDITTTGSVIVGTAGAIQGGATSFSAGTGFWLGNDAGTYKFRIGATGAGNQRLEWNGSTLFLQANQLSIGSLAVSNGDVWQSSGSLTMRTTAAASALTLSSPGGVVVTGIGHAMRPSADGTMSLGTASFRFTSAHFNLPNDTAPGYVVVGNSSVDGTRLAYIVGVTATKTVRNSAGTGTCTLIFQTGLLTGGTC